MPKMFEYQLECNVPTVREGRGKVFRARMYTREAYDSQIAKIEFYDRQQSLHLPGLIGPDELLEGEVVLPEKLDDRGNVTVRGKKKSLLTYSGMEFYRVKRFLHEDGILVLDSKVVDVVEVGDGGLKTPVGEEITHVLLTDNWISMFEGTCQVLGIGVKGIDRKGLLMARR